MSIREANRRDGDGRNSDGCGEEKGGAYANRRKSRGKMEWRGIKLTLDEREREKKKNRVGKQQIEMEGGEQWNQLTDREKSCGFGAWEGECKRSIDYS